MKGKRKILAGMIVVLLLAVAGLMTGSTMVGAVDATKVISIEDVGLLTIHYPVMGEEGKKEFLESFSRVGRKIYEISATFLIPTHNLLDFPNSLTFSLKSGENIEIPMYLIWEGISCGEDYYEIQGRFLAKANAWMITCLICRIAEGLPMELEIVKSVPESPFGQPSVFRLYPLEEK